MKWFRHGSLGAERPGLVDASGALRDLSGVLPDTASAAPGRDSMSRLRAAEPDTLPLVPPGTRRKPA